MNRYSCIYLLCLVGSAFVIGCQSSKPVSDAPELSADDVIIATDASALYYDHCDFGRLRQTNGNAASDLLKQKLDKISQCLISGDYDEVLLFVHGGMNTRNDGIESARKKFAALTKHPLPGRKILPVFLTWDSGLPSSYWAHLVHEESGISYRDRQGVRAMNVVKGLFLDLPTDLGVGLVTTPRSLVTGMAKSLQNMNSLYQTAPNLFPTRQTFLQTLQREFCQTNLTEGGISYESGLYCPAGLRKKYHVSLGLSRKHRFENNTLNLAFSPAKAGFSPFYEAIGTPAWHNMTRRTQTLVYRSPTIQSSSEMRSQTKGPSRVADGVLAVLLDRIGEWQKRDTQLKLTVAGHSMGTMVLNSGFRAITKGQVTPVKIDRIIYMAAACSIRDFQDTAGRYLKEHPNTDCYNLCLNPFREIGEHQPLQAAPLFLSGSLLIWIDEFFEKPHDFLDRTFGTFENAIIANQHLPQNARFTLKAFGEKGADRSHPAHDLGPQVHGAFGDYRFWEPTFLEAKDPKTPDCYRHLQIGKR